jgi:hypothetical protein
MGFLFSISGSCSRLGMGTMGERIIQPVGGKALTNAHHRVPTHFERFGHLFIGPTRTCSVAINLEQDPSMREFAGGGFAFGYQLMERVALLFTEFYFILVGAILHISLLESGFSLVEPLG